MDTQRLVRIYRDVFIFNRYSIFPMDILLERKKMKFNQVSGMLNMSSKQVQVQFASVQISYLFYILVQLIDDILLNN